jgi:hypothetical protein
MHLISSRDKRCPRVRAEFPSWFGASEAAWAEGGEKAKLDGGEQDFGNPKAKAVCRMLSRVGGSATDSVTFSTLRCQ